MGKIIEWLAKKYKKSPARAFVQAMIDSSIPILSSIFSFINTYLLMKEEKIRQFEKFHSIRDILNFTERCDSKIRPIVREHQIIKQNDLIWEYSNHINAVFKENKMNIDIEDFLDEVEKFNFLTGLYFNNPDLVINIEKDFSEIIFESNNSKIIIKNPNLLWDCHCKVPKGCFRPEDRPKNADKIPCPIHSSELGDYISSKFKNGIVQIQYDGIKVLWHNSYEFWPPSIDTIHMYENLKKDGIMDRHIETVLDIGSGTGFLGIAIAKYNPNVQKLYLSDWLLTPTVFSRINWEINKGNKTHVSCIPCLGLGFNWLNHEFPSEPFDICVCNPPYLPDLKNFPEIRMNHAVGGTDLLEEIIKNGYKIAKEIYVNFSNIAEKEAYSAANDVNAKLIKIGKSLTVPFRVSSALKNKKYIRELSQKRGLQVLKDGRYKYWHTISTYKIIY